MEFPWSIRNEIGQQSVSRKEREMNDFVEREYDSGPNETEQSVRSTLEQ